VQWRELRWWFIVPAPGESRRWATYDWPARELEDISDLEVLGRTRVHEEECFEIRHRSYSSYGEFTREALAYGDLRQGVARWFGWWNMSDERKVYTYLDEGFEHDWGPADPIRLMDVGRYRWIDDQRLVDAEAVSAEHADPVNRNGAGLWEISVGKTRLRCVRVIEVSPDAAGEPCRICDGFVTLDGRGVIMRRYEAPDTTYVWWEGRKASEVLADSPRLVYNGMTYHLWYDSIAEDVLAPSPTD